jgi:hypothetical protein
MLGTKQLNGSDLTRFIRCRGWIRSKPDVADVGEDYKADAADVEDDYKTDVEDVEEDHKPDVADFKQDRSDLNQM